MSIIGVKVPLSWTIKTVVNNFMKHIRGQFEAINFDPKYRDSVKKKKICYIRLSEKLDPQQVIERLNVVRIGNWGYLEGFVPDEIPDLPVAAKVKGMKNMSVVPDTPASILLKTHGEILYELQCKYTGLFNLSRKYEHRLLESLAKTIYERLKNLMTNDLEASESCFLLSKAYRVAHTHFADFQCILTHLHRIEDDLGKPRTEILESDLMRVHTSSHTVNNVPFKQVEAACHKYSSKISAKLEDHFKSLNSEPKSDDSPEEVARKKIRSELKKLSPFMPLLLKQVISKHLVMKKTPYHKMRIYGDPSLPTKDLLVDFLRKYRFVKMHRSDKMYNLVLFYVSETRYNDLMTLDGSVVNGNKLYIRSSEIPLYTISDSLKMEMKRAFGGTGEEVFDEDDAEANANDEMAVGEIMHEYGMEY
ncbi:uncharacterized protein LOC125489336 [Plutella xylostella]|uniref:uncharacterized protein LOC125489336 n=1 Tax=Plutella xylostella TaxID=51655 RepID=UPI002032BCAC|nr:uncharacterized protein LOC125489336 [Plutella xylostella]